MFTTVLEEDAGDYECLPTNQYGGTGFTQSISVWGEYGVDYTTVHVHMYHNLCFL